MRIRSKLITIILALAIIPMVFVGYCIFNTAKRNLEESILDKLKTITNTKADILETFVAERKNDLVILQHRNVIKTTFPVLAQFSRDRDNPSYIEAKKTLDYQLNILQTVYKYANILLLNKDGEVIYVSSPEHETTDLEKYMSGLDNEVFQKADSEIRIGDVLKTNCKEHPYIMVMAGALYDAEENKFMGSIYLALDMNSVYKTISDNTGLGQSGETLLVKKTTDNKVLFLSPLKYDPDAVLKKNIIPGANAAVPAQEAAAGKTGSGLYIDYRGNEVLSVWQPVSSLGWGMVAKIDTKEAFRQIEKLKKIVLVILLITIPLIMLTALTTAKSISDPIQHLHKGTEIIGSGNLDYKVGTDVKDEVGQLSRAFDTMTENLKNTTISIESLHKEVVKRKWAEKVLQTEKDNLKAIFETAPIGMVLLNEKAEVIKINGIIEKIVGEYRLGDQPGNLFKCIHSIENPKGCGYSPSCPKCPIRNAIKTVLQNGFTAHCTEIMVTLLINDKPTNIWLEINAEPITLDEKKCAILAINNITDRKQAEEELQWKTALLESQVEATLDGVLVVDGQGQRILINKRLIELWKIPPQITEDKNDETMLQYVVSQTKSPEQFLEKVKYLYLHQNETSRDEIEFKNGMIFDRYSSPVIDKNERYFGRIWTFRDITEHKSAEIALKESEEKYKTLYESSQDAIMILTAERGFISGNPATLKLFGCKDEKEFASLTPAALSPKNQPDGTDSAVKAQEMMKIAMEKGSHFFEWTHKRMDNTEFPATVLLTSTEIKNEKVLQATVRDITESKKAEKEMKEAVEMKSKFISAASHELRTPLTSIKEGINLVYSETTGPLNNDQKEFLGIAKRNVDRLANLINDVLDFQKMTAGRMAFNPQPASINEIVRIAEETMRPLAKEKGLEFVIELDDAIPLVSFDKDKIIQVLINLANNAIKFTETGSVKITTSRNDNSIITSVKDSGVGIKKEDIPRLFQEFEQLTNKTTDRKTGGTGLGLVISKKIIENHNGRIWAESDYGKGTTFYFTLPMEPILCQIKS